MSRIGLSIHNQDGDLPLDFHMAALFKDYIGICRQLEDRFILIRLITNSLKFQFTVQLVGPSADLGSSNNKFYFLLKLSNNLVVEIFAYILGKMSMIQRHIFIIYFDIYNKIHRYSSLEKKKLKQQGTVDGTKKRKKGHKRSEKNDIRETRKMDAILKN